MAINICEPVLVSVVLDRIKGRIWSGSELSALSEGAEVTQELIGGEQRKRRVTDNLVSGVNDNERPESRFVGDRNA